ncbi:hypothetical protein FA95DRAFT_1562053 [Auriscalpium vulgare]|uniref:Uncharacterized protein n=1 Tax=Auriscalpium vulgare TaxID=40419 RepID=A0ACB8RKF8_9AGAM|nr:hypothetical protein FA95DRAFT_1562053 [Auriscalpium vulgare]
MVDVLTWHWMVYFSLIAVSSLHCYYRPLPSLSCRSLDLQCKEDVTNAARGQHTPEYSPSFLP